MPFLHASGVLPFLLLGIRISKEIEQVLIQLSLILFDNGQIIASLCMHTGTPLLLRMHGIGTNDASFHQRRVHQRSSSTDLIFFAFDSAVRQDDPALALIEGEQMHRRLSLTLMSQRST